MFLIVPDLKLNLVVKESERRVFKLLTKTPFLAEDGPWVMGYSQQGN